MKTNEELNALKKEVETVNEKLQELTPEEIAQISGGAVHLTFGGGAHLTLADARLEQFATSIAVGDSVHMHGKHVSELSGLERSFAGSAGKLVE